MRELFPRLDSIYHIHVSPDGEKMVFFRARDGVSRAEIVIADLGSPDGTVLAVNDHPEGNLSGMYGQPLFSPDGSQVAFLRQDWSQPGVLSASLWVVPSDASAPARLVARAPVIQRPIWHEQGDFIAFLAWDPPNSTKTVSVVSLVTGEVHAAHPPFRGQDGINVNDWSPDGRWIGITHGAERTWGYWVVDDPLAGSG
jgi:Tol biopolymer transport system component